MTKEDIIKALESGNYKIEHREDCGCSFNWDFDGDGITDNCDGNECWEGNILVINGEDIAQHIRYEAAEMLTDIIDADDISDDIWDEMRMSDMVERGESANNDTHERNRRDTLIEWLNQLVADGYRLMRDNERGFANEYVVLLVSPGTDADDVDDDWDELSADNWADEYLYNGDAATEAYNGVKVI